MADASKRTRNLIIGGVAVVLVVVAVAAVVASQRVEQHRDGVAAPGRRLLQDAAASARRCPPTPSARHACTVRRGSRARQHDGEQHEAEAAGRARRRPRVRRRVPGEVQAADHRRLHRHHRRDHPVGRVQVGPRRQHRARPGRRREPLAPEHRERHGAALAAATARPATTAIRARRRSASCRSSGTSTRPRARSAAATR